MSLKKAKHELESKIKDQEEELDDQAGQIQQLEQVGCNTVKTRLPPLKCCKKKSCINCHLEDTVNKITCTGVMQ